MQFIWGILFASLFCNTAYSTPQEELELERLDKIEQQLGVQREWADYRWKKATAECYNKYWVNSCLKDVRAEYRKEIDPIRSQEVEVHADQRTLRESIKTQRDAKRAAELADPAKAAERDKNQQDYEKKQKDAQARAADLEQRRKDAPRRAQENKAGTQLD